MQLKKDEKELDKMEHKKSKKHHKKSESWGTYLKKAF